MNVELTFFEWLTPYSWPLRGTVESLTYPWPFTWSRWRTCEVSTLYLENCANTRRIYVFWVINPSFLTPPWYKRIISFSMTFSVELLTCLWSFNSVSWKLCECMPNLRFFEWLTVYFWAPRVTVVSSTPPRPVPESQWRTCEVSTLYLENCANACRIYVFLND